MQDDDLLGLLIGCECRKKCCEEHDRPTTPTGAPAPLFQAGSRTKSPASRPADDAFVPPAPDYDAWPRPVMIGRTALTLPTPTGKPLLFGPLPEPAAPTGSRSLISHIQGKIITRPDELNFVGERLLEDGEWNVTPFTPSQYVLTDMFPAGRTNEKGLPAGAFPDDDHFPRWRIKGTRGAAQGVMMGKVLKRDLETGEIDQSQIISVPAESPTLEVEARMYFDTFVSLDENGFSSVFNVGEDAFWGIPDRMEVWAVSQFKSPFDTQAGYPVGYFPTFSCKHPKHGSRYYVSNLQNAFSGTPHVTYQGRTKTGYDATIGIRQSSGSMIARGVGPAGHLEAIYPINRLLFASWSHLPPLKDPEPYQHQFEADLAGIGRVEAGGADMTINTGTHLDHPRAADGGFLRLGGKSLECSSWAIVARQTKDHKGIERGLLTCDGAKLTVRWPERDAVEVLLTDLLSGVLEKDEGVSDALLESDFAQFQHPDQVRLIWAQGKNAALIVPWEPWRDWTKEAWQKAHKGRPRTLKQWLAVPAERWPTGPPLPTEKDPHPEPYDLSVIGLITPPPLDTAGLPRYGKDPKIAYGIGAFGAKWPWAERGQLQKPDERPDLKVQAIEAFPEVDEGIIVGRIRGRLPDGAVWLGPKANRWGLRVFASLKPPKLERDQKLRLQHYAVYKPDSTVDA